MSTAASDTASGEQLSRVEHLDVLIIGAGLSGIGCGCYLRRDRPDATFAILESRSATGGTWDLFRYPGIRSDSDVHTFGYEFKPWPTDTVLASGPEIRDYIRATADEYGVTDRIRLDRRVISASWDSTAARWTVEVECTDSGAREQVTCGWLFGATGYYRYDEGYTPPLPNLDRYAGTVVHPQHWPSELDFRGKRVIVIGSGATAVTLVPALTQSGAGHVTMLQRSPTYMMSLPSQDALAGLAKRVLGPARAFRLTRAKNIFVASTLFKLCQRFPKAMRKLLVGGAARALGDGFDIERDFNPRYDPWDQRLCFMPDGDFFKSLRAGQADVVTGQIETFTETGLRLADGRELTADIVVTATGLNLLAFGGITLTVDGEPVDVPKTVAFRGMMLSGVPNFAFLVGYTNISWTLKVGLVCGHLVRLLEYMDVHKYDKCVPELPYPRMATRPLLDFQAGYVLRSLDQLPRQGVQGPWYLAMDYRVDRRNLSEGPVEDRNLNFSVRPRTDATAGVASDLTVPA